MNTEIFNKIKHLIRTYGPCWCNYHLAGCTIYEVYYDGIMDELKFHYPGGKFTEREISFTDAEEIFKQLVRNMHNKLYTTIEECRKKENEAQSSYLLFSDEYNTELNSLNS